MSSKSTQNLVNQLRQVLKDAIDYFQSVVQLIQARTAELALSSAVFLALILFASIFALAAFVMLNIAFGVWLAHVLKGGGWAVITLGLIYSLLALIMGGVAMRWLNRLKS